MATSTSVRNLPQWAKSCVKIAIGMALFCLWLPGCRRAGAPLRVGGNVWTGYEPMYLARSLGYYGERSIRLIDFPSAAEVIRAYQNGLIDVAAVTADESLIVCESQENQRIVLVCDFSNGADVLLARPEFQSMQDLQGKRVGVEGTVLGAYVLARALECNGLSGSDVASVQVPLIEHEDAFKTGKVDAVVTFEPHRSTLLAAGARDLFNSSQIPGEIVDVLLTRNDLTTAQNRNVATLVNGWFRALQYLREHPADAAARIAEREQLTPEQFLESIKAVKFPGREENLKMLAASAEGPAGKLREVLTKLTALMIRHGLSSKPIRQPTLDGSFVRAAKP